MPPEGVRLPVVDADLSGPEPVFRRIAIIGVGMMGGSLGLAAREAWPSALVIGVDSNDVLETAMRLHAVDVGADDPVVAAEADLVVLAAPVDANIRLLGALSENIPGEAVVTDLGASKRTTVDAARALPARLTFIGGHPLAGATRSGIEFARPDLFAGRPWVLTPVSAPAGALDRLSRFVQGVGARPVIQTPDAHDHLIAYLGHLPQLVACALMKVIGDAVGESGLALAGRGLADTTRLAAGSADVWADVLASNRDEIGPALDALCDAIGSVRNRLDSRDAVEELFGAANRWRARLTPEPSPGGQFPRAPENSTPSS
jgi:prephenate dehydrogenase